MNYLVIIPYGILVSALFILCKPYLRQYFIAKKIDAKVKLESGGRLKKRLDIKLDPFSSHIYMLLKTVFPMAGVQAVLYFYLISIFFGLLGLIFTIKLLPTMLGIFITTGLLILPYWTMLGRLQVVRVKTSFEGDILISTLLNNYKISYYNMQEAIEKTGLELDDAPFSKELLLNLAKGLSRTGSDKEVKDLVDSFKFAIGTTWGNILATNIYFAATSGIRVTDALTDLSESISKARKVLEYTRRENNEAMLMLKYLAPVCYLLTIIGSIRYFGFTLDRFFAYQFNTPTGITWFSIILTTYIIGIFAAIFFSKRKMEL